MKSKIVTFASVSTHASVRRRQIGVEAAAELLRFQLTPP